MKKKILVLCTGNSCRSQIAHGYLQQFGGDKVEVYSAGVETHGVNLKAIKTMKEDGIDISTHTSNNVLEYQGIDFDFVITVCDNAAGEVCPVWPGKPATAHWGFPDPSQVKGNDLEKKSAFISVMNGLKKRIDLLASMPLDTLDSMSLKEIHTKT